MQPDVYSRLRWIAIFLAVFCAWCDFSLQSPPRPRLASYEWRRTAQGWQEIPRWEPPAALSPVAARPFVLASVLLGLSAIVLSLRPASILGAPADSPAYPVEAPSAT